MARLPDDSLLRQASAGAKAALITHMFATGEANTDMLQAVFAELGYTLDERMAIMEQVEEQLRAQRYPARDIWKLRDLLVSDAAPAPAEGMPAGQPTPPEGLPRQAPPARPSPSRMRRAPAANQYVPPQPVAPAQQGLPPQQVLPPPPPAGATPQPAAGVPTAAAAPPPPPAGATPQPAGGVPTAAAAPPTPPAGATPPPWLSQDSRVERLPERPVLPPRADGLLREGDIQPTMPQGAAGSARSQAPEGDKPKGTGTAPSFSTVPFSGFKFEAEAGPAGRTGTPPTPVPPPTAPRPPAPSAAAAPTPPVPAAAPPPIPRVGVPTPPVAAQRGDGTVFGGQIKRLNTKEIMRGMTPKKTVLLADDDSRVRMIYKLKFEDAGYSVREAGEGNEAWRIIRTREVDVAVLDMKMPGLHGLEVISRMVDEGITMPVIICSAYEQLGDEFVVATYPNLKYLVKPVAPEQLVAAVREFVGAP